MPTISEVLAENYPDQYHRAVSWREWLGDLGVQEQILAELGLDVDDFASIADRRVVLGVGLTVVGSGYASGSPPTSTPTVQAAVLLRSSAPSILRLASLDDGGEWFDARGPGSPGVVDHLRRSRSVIAGLLGHPEHEVAVIGLPAPVEQVGPGDEAHCGAGPASFGSRVWLQRGARGLLTAGHAAPVVGAAAYDASSNVVGKVIDTVDCGSATVGAGAPTPDVATIELDQNAPDTLTNAPQANAPPGTATLWDTVTSYGAVTAGQSASVLIAGASFAGSSPTTAVYGETLQTAYPISASGDSGAPVYNQSGDLVGHVVAGYAGVYSVVQDASYQLNAFGASLR
jgi:hypothetical protein